MAEAFLAGLIGFLIGRGIPRKDAESIVKALQEYIGFEPPLGLTGYALCDMLQGKEYNAAVVVRGKTYDVTALNDIGKYDEVSILGKKNSLLEVASVIKSLKSIRFIHPFLDRTLAATTRTLTTDVEELLHSYTKGHSQITRLEFSTNDKSVELRLYDEAWIGAFMHKIPNRDGSSIVPVSPENLNDIGGESAWFKLVKYDTTNNYFVIILKNSLNFNHRFWLCAYQNTGVDKNVAFTLNYYKL